MSPPSIISQAEKGTVVFCYHPEHWFWERTQLQEEEQPLVWFWYLLIGHISILKFFSAHSLLVCWIRLPPSRTAMPTDDRRTKRLIETTMTPLSLVGAPRRCPGWSVSTNSSLSLSLPSVIQSVWCWSWFWSTGDSTDCLESNFLITILP